MGVPVELVANLLNPSSVAIVGASERSPWASGIVNNLRTLGFAGVLKLVHPVETRQFGQECYRSLLAVPDPIDHALILVGASRVMAVLQECAARDIRAVTVLSSGFSEAGTAGAQRQEELTRFCVEQGIALVGPNCLGFVNYRTAATLATAFAVTGRPIPGHIGLVMQSGSMMGLMHGMAENRGIGYSYLISSGNEAVVDVGDYFRYMVEDAETRVIGGLLEGIRNPAAFAEVCQRAMDLGKPVVILKLGRSAIAARAAQAHTGALAGTDDVVDAYFKKLGVIRVDTPEDLLEAAALLAANGWPNGRRFAAVGSSGGACGLFADLAHRTAIELPELSATTQRELSAVLKLQFGSVQNPLDLTGQVVESPDMMPNAVDALLRDSGIDGVVALNEPMRHTDSLKEWRVGTQRGLANVMKRHNKFACAMSQVSQDMTELGREGAAAAGIHYVNGEGRGIVALDKALRYGEERRRYLARKANAPALVDPLPARDAVDALLSGRSGTLNEADSKALLRMYGIATTREIMATDAESAVRAADTIGYPVVLKVLAVDVPHKTEAGGVLLNLRTQKDVRSGYAQICASVRDFKPDANISGVLVAEQIAQAHELFAGVTVDPLYGSVVVTGLGGIFVEALRDVAMAIAPVDMEDAHALLDELRGRRILDGLRGRPPADVVSVCETLCRLGRLAVDLEGRIAEVDVNPLFVLPAGKGVRAADALVILKDNQVGRNGLVRGGA